MYATRSKRKVRKSSKINEKIKENGENSEKNYMKYSNGYAN